MGGIAGMCAGDLLLPMGGSWDAPHGSSHPAHDKQGLKPEHISSMVTVPCVLIVFGGVHPGSSPARWPYAAGPRCPSGSAVTCTGLCRLVCSTLAWPSAHAVVSIPVLSAFLSAGSYPAGNAAALTMSKPRLKPTASTYLTAGKCCSGKQPPNLTHSEVESCCCSCPWLHTGLSSCWPCGPPRGIALADVPAAAAHARTKLCLRPCLQRQPSLCVPAPLQWMQGSGAISTQLPPLHSTRRCGTAC